MGSLDRRLPGQGTGPYTPPQCVKCGRRVLPSELDRPLPGLSTRVCRAGFGCAAGDRPAVSLDDAVREVLRDAREPLGPTAIAQAVLERYGMEVRREALDRALFRVGQRVGRGRYVAQEGGQ